MKKKSLLVTLLLAAVVLSAGALYALSVDSTTVDASALSVDSTTDASGTAVSTSTEGPWMSISFPIESVLSTNIKELCPRPDVYCLDVYDPVYCTSDGQTYSNACYAWRACATGCTGGGGSSS